MFFVNSLENLTVGFDISTYTYITFSDSSTRSSMTFKLKHTSSTSNTQCHFYFNHLSSLWNSLLPMDLNSSVSTIKSPIIKFLCTQFNAHFDSNNSCTTISSIHAVNASLPLSSLNCPRLLVILFSCLQCIHSELHLHVVSVIFVYLCTAKFKLNQIKPNQIIRLFPFLKSKTISLYLG